MPCKAIPADSNSRQEKADLGCREQLHANEWRGMQRKNSTLRFPYAMGKMSLVRHQEFVQRKAETEGHAVMTHDKQVHKPSPWHPWCGTRSTCTKMRRRLRFAAMDKFRKRSQLPRLSTGMPPAQLILPPARASFVQYVRATDALAQRRGWRRIPIASSRCRQRQRRTCDSRPERLSRAHSEQPRADPEPRASWCRAAASVFCSAGLACRATRSILKAV